jgi:UPF0716 family protein affecting phage T7 exclusion
MLVLPGFVTDTLGFTLLIPPLRRRLARYIVDRWGGGPGDGNVIVIRR